MKAGDRPLRHGASGAGQTVFDVVYGHGETALAGSGRRVPVFDGAGMLVGQAVVTVGILRDITGEAALDIPELFALMAPAAGFNLA
ncbi:MAG: hypothetical protein ACLUE1_07215 [Adlercreutzia equolifaciens]